jgi:hypothetical protein
MIYLEYTITYALCGKTHWIKLRRQIRKDGDVWIKQLGNIALHLDWFQTPPQEIWFDLNIRYVYLLFLLNFFLSCWTTILPF